MRSGENKMCRHCGKVFTPRKYLKHLNDYKVPLNVIETCSIFNVSRWTLRRWIKDSNFKGEIIGRETIYPRSLLDKLFKPIEHNTIASISNLPNILNPKRLIRLTIKWEGCKKSRVFKVNDIDKQLEWLKTYKRQFVNNKERSKQSDYVEGMKLFYSKEDI